jgi:hypothetical protein
MKHIIIILLLSMGFAGFAQQVKYKTAFDTPEQLPNISINMEYAQIDFMRMLDASSFNVGLFGYVNVLENKLNIDYLVRKSWFALGRLGNQDLPGNFDLNLGGSFYLTSRKKQKQIKVVLDAKHYNGVRESTTVTTYIMAPGHVQISLGIRGGLYYKSNLYMYSNDEITPLTDYSGKMTQAGLYLGLVRRVSKNLILDTENYDRSFNSIAGEFYVDALILPVNKFTEYEQITGTDPIDFTATIKGAFDESPIGFRVGYRAYQIAPKSETGKKFGMSFTFEGGIKPYLGWFLNAGLGITLVKKR